MKVVTRIHILLSCIVFLYFLQQPLGFTFAAIDPNKPVSDLFKQEEPHDDKESPPQEQPAGANEEKSSNPQLGTSAWDYVKTFLSLAFVIGLLIALLKYMQRRNRQFNRHRLLKSIGGLPLGQNKSIQLVQIGDAYYVVGVGEDVRLLKEITDPEEIRTIEVHMEEQQTPIDTPIGIWLQKFRNRTSTKSTVPAQQSERFEHVFQSTLDELKKERQQKLRRLTEKEHNPNE